MASKCYTNGFQLHLNYLDECAKRTKGAIQEKSLHRPESTILRLPSSAILSRSLNKQAQLHPKDNVHSTQFKSIDNFAADFIVLSTPKPSNSSELDRDCERQVKRNDFRGNEASTTLFWCKNKSIYRLKFLTHVTSTGNSCYSIKNNSGLGTANTEHTETEILHRKIQALNAAKNNMNPVAIHAKNAQQQHDLQLFNQPIECNYISNDNDNFRYYYKSQPNNQVLLHQESHGTANLVQSKEQTGVNELVKVFSHSLSLSDTLKTTLPQIILSDFSSDQPTPPTTPLLFTNTINNNETSTNHTLSETIPSTFFTSSANDSVFLSIKTN